MRKLFTFLIVLLLSASAFGLAIEAPSKVVVDSEERTFTVTLTNPSGQTEEFELEFFCPARFEMENVPSRLGPHESRTIRITVSHADKLIGPTYTALLKASSDEFTVGKEIKLEFLDLKTAEEQADQANKPQENIEQPSEADSMVTGLMGLIALPAMPEMVLDAVLILVAAVLLIAFISRFVKRVQ